MLRPLMTCTLVLAIAPALAAQDKPTPAAQQAITATWQFDQARSDTIGNDPLAGAVGGGPALGGGARPAGGGGGGGGGRGGRGGGGGGGGGTGSASAPSTGTAPPNMIASGRGRDPHLQVVLEDANPGAGFVIAANDTVVALATSAMVKAGTQTDWRTDGKKHQDVQMDGSIIETQATWNDAALTTIRNVPGVGSLKREFKVSKDGKTLEVKENIEAGGRKVEKKLVFSRKQ